MAKTVRTDCGAAAMEEFGFKVVSLGRPGSPTPGRIADRLADILIDLDIAIERGDLGMICEAMNTAKRLRTALDRWDCEINHHH